MADAWAPQSESLQDCYGYYFHHPEPGFEWGAPELEVKLRSNPTKRHFDPEQLRLRIVEQDEDLDYVRIYHPWPGGRQMRAVIGDIVLRDRKDKTLEAFTFGGTLAIEREEECTHCNLASPVPIIDLRDDHREARLLASEAKALIARRRVDWKHDLARFEARIAQANPEDLYYAILLRLEEEYRIYPKDERISAQEFLNFLRAQIDLARLKFKRTQLPADIEAIV